MHTTPKDQDSQKSRPLVRLAVMAVALVVVVALLAPRSSTQHAEGKTTSYLMSERGSVGGEKSMKEYTELVAREDAVAYGDECADWFSKQTSAAQKSQGASELVEKFPASAGAVISVVEKDGKVKQLAWTDENLNKIRETWKGMVGAKSEKHKWVQVSPTERLILYPDNTVVTMDTHNCRLTGMYGQSLEGEVHPSLTEKIMENQNVMADKGKKCNQHDVTTCYSNNARPGMVCRSRTDPLHPLEYESPYTSKQRSRCPNGWTPEGWSPVPGTVFRRRKCGCGTACTPALHCDHLGSVGKCQVRYDVCNLQTSVKLKIAESNKVLNAVQKVVKVTASVAAVAGAIAGIGPVFGAGAGLVAAVFGATKKSPTGPGAAYEQIESTLIKLADDIAACFKVVLVLSQQHTIEAELRVVGQRLNPIHLNESKSFENRERLVWVPNHGTCQTLGSRFAGLVGTPDANRVLPLAPQIMEFCIANYLGYIGDLNSEGKVVPSLLVNQMTTMVSSVYGAVNSVRDAYWNKYSTSEQCGFYKNDYNFLVGKVNTINNEIIGPVKQLAANFIAV